MKERRAFAVFLLIYLGFVAGFLVWVGRRSHVPQVEPVAVSKTVVRSTPAPTLEQQPKEPVATAPKTKLPGDIPSPRVALNKVSRAKLLHTSPEGAVQPRQVRAERHEDLEPAPLASAKLQPVAAKRKDLAPLSQVVLPEERDRTIVSALLLRASDRIQRIYKRRVLRNPDLSGKLTVRFLVDPTGRVVDTQVIENELRDPELAKGVCETIRGLTFPPVQEKTGPEFFRQTFLFQGV